MCLLFLGSRGSTQPQAHPDSARPLGRLAHPGLRAQRHVLGRLVTVWLAAGPHVVPCREGAELLVLQPGMSTACVSWSARVSAPSSSPVARWPPWPSFSLEMQM